MFKINRTSLNLVALFKKILRSKMEFKHCDRMDRIYTHYDEKYSISYYFINKFKKQWLSLNNSVTIPLKMNPF